jgi:hypothetical protein
MLNSKLKSVIWKTFKFLICVSFISVISTCEKDDENSFSYDCMLKHTTYKDSIAIYTLNEYFLNKMLIKLETSGGYYEERRYDRKCNLIFLIQNNTKWIYEYNQFNKVTKSIFYLDGILNSTTFTKYIDTLKIEEYTINEPSGDTAYFTKYYYNSEVRLDSSITDDSFNTYYYYSEEIDSSVSVGAYSRRIFDQTYTKYNNRKIISREYKSYSFNGYSITTFEYNAKQLLSRRTQKSHSSTGYNVQYDKRYYYNDINLLTRIENYNEYYSLVEYSILSYEDTDLIKIESFNNLNIAINYTLVEKTCSDN